jgi:hypothetical protein
MRQGPHPATIARKPMKDFVFSSQEVPKQDPNKYIGRRTGKIYDDKYANGNDFLMQNDKSNIQEKRQILDLYESESETSSESEKSNKSWTSSSEAEESDIQEEIEEDSKEQSKIKTMTNKNILTNNQAAQNNSINLKDLRNNLLKDSDSNDQMLYSMINNKPQENSSSSSSSSSSPSPQKIIEKNLPINSKNKNYKPLSSNINATNNFLKSPNSDNKSIQSSKYSNFSFVPHEELNKFNNRIEENEDEKFKSEDDDFDLTIISKKVKK